MKILNFFFLVSIFVIFVNCNKVQVASFIVKDVLTKINSSKYNDINAFLEGDNVKAKRDETENYENYNACSKEQESFSDCLGNNKSIDDSEFCKILNEERCVKFYKDPASNFPSCEKFDHFTNLGISASYKYLGSIYQLFCANNSNCTIAKQLVDTLEIGKSTGNFQPSEFNTPSEEALKNDCSHKDCVDAAINMYEYQKEFVKTILEVNKEKDKNYVQTEEKKKNTDELLSSADKTLEYLHSCAQKSGAITLITNNILLLSIITVFVIFLIK